MAGIDDDVAQAVVHLRWAAEAMDRLWNATGNDDVDRAVLGLGEATLAIHQALLALGEWDVAITVTPGVPAVGPSTFAGRAPLS